jgi:hypothetical protein
MDKIKFIANNESEFVTIMTWLEEFEVPYQVKMLQNPTHSSLNILRPLAEFYIPEENAKDLGDFLISRRNNIALQESEVEMQEENKTPAEMNKKKNRSMLVLGIYALVVSVIAIRYYYLEKQQSTDKNFKWDWNYDFTELTLSYRKTNKALVVSYDKNRDYNFERAELYHLGKLYSVEYDFDEDGYTDSKMFYSKPDNYIGCMKFYNNDPFIDYQEIVLQSGDTLRLYDADQNGILELK